METSSQLFVEVFTPTGFLRNLLSVIPTASQSSCALDIQIISLNFAEATDILK